MTTTTTTTTATWTIKFNKTSTTMTHVASGAKYRIGCPGVDAHGALALCVGYARGNANRARREAAEMERVGMIGRRSSASHRLAQIWDRRASDIQDLLVDMEHDSRVAWVEGGGNLGDY